MNCKFCGRNNSSSMKYCYGCGHLLESDPASPGSLDPYANRPGGKASPYYAPPMGYSAPGGPHYRSLSSVPLTGAFWLAVFLIVISFTSMFMPWITVKISISGYSVKESADYTDIFDNYDPDYISKLRSAGLKDSRLERMNNCVKVMKWAGAAGYLCLILTVVVGVVAKNHMVSAAALSALLFIISAGAAVLYCFTCKDYIESFSKDYSKFLKVFPNAGIWVSFGCTLLAAVLAGSDLRSRRRLLASDSSL